MRLDENVFCFSGGTVVVPVCYGLNFRSMTSKFQIVTKDLSDSLRSVGDTLEGADELCIVPPYQYFVWHVLW